MWIQYKWWSRQSITKELSLDDAKRMFNPEFIKQLNVSICAAT